MEKKYHESKWKDNEVINRKSWSQSYKTILVLKKYKLVLDYLTVCYTI